MKRFSSVLSRFWSFWVVGILFGMLSAACVAENTSAGRVSAENRVTVGTNEQFRGPVGLQMYSFRSVAKEDMDAAMKLAAEMGFQYIEASGFYDLSAEEYQALLEKYQLKAGAKNWGLGEFLTEEGLKKIIHEAKVLDIKYVGIAWYPHKNGVFTYQDAQEAVTTFNRIGERLKKEGLIFVYHNHGYEFYPWEGGKEGETLFDYMIQNTNPECVAFEMDVLWTIFPGADPATLLKKYPNRFRLMHLKDLKKGVEGNLSGGTPVENDVAIGSGQANYPEILKAAQEAGVEYYFIEDESPIFKTQVPKSLKYLESVYWK
ncbi:MAG: sugar phosphate isomerase/epimerase [Planctomycetia bacterium]|nr:sugar phosphate isomerase/epimerase [Planctomycetia bacterium]